MYRNKWTGALLTDEEYRALREREVASFWNELSEEEKEEWGSFEEFRQKEFGIWPDGDFEYLKTVEEMTKYKMSKETAQEFLEIPDKVFNVTVKSVSIEIDENGNGHIWVHGNNLAEWIETVADFEKHYMDSIEKRLDRIEIQEKRRGEKTSFRFWKRHKIMLDYISRKEGRDRTAELEHLIEERYLELKKKA